ncbi:type II toxin-antitoxin system RelE/ParE family toxin [Pelagerythrobacter sp.]|uniref:type II toxin-antitoxin system RelE/ParE family toxin n=1 Tax=Pelagerythrobacter sp. TaxID=2800702 RepID=UPI0035AE6C97
MIRVIWRERALEELEDIIDYVGDRDIAAAIRLQARIRACAERIVYAPRAYRKGRIEDTREAVAHPNYILVFRLTDEAVEIVNVIHSRQQYPPRG